MSWVEALGGWLVTSRDLVVEVMRSPELFTVDDPRFTTAQVVGPSMLSLDGEEHARHRAAFAAAFRKSDVHPRLGASVPDAAFRIVASLVPRGSAELPRDLAGPLAVTVIADALGLHDVEVGSVLDWYDAIVASVDGLSVGQPASPAGDAAVESLRAAVEASIARGGSLLADAAASLSHREVVSNTAVMMFGGIETAEGMTANLLWHLLSDPEQLEGVRTDRSRLANAVEESLRLEPAASRVDRYATTNIELAGANIATADLVIASLAGANRDPTVFSDPDRFDIARTNASEDVSFAHGPHACVGLHLARLETMAAVDAMLDLLPGVRLDPATHAGATGLIFRKPEVVQVTWDVTSVVGPQPAPRVSP